MIVFSIIFCGQLSEIASKTEGDQELAFGPPVDTIPKVAPSKGPAFAEQRKLSVLPTAFKAEK